MIQAASAQQQLKEQQRKHSSPAMNSSFQGPVSTVASTHTSLSVHAIQNPISSI